KRAFSASRSPAGRSSTSAAPSAARPSAAPSPTWPRSRSAPSRSSTLTRRARGKPPVRSGLAEMLSRSARWRGLRLGLIANPTAVTASLDHAAVLMNEAKNLRLVALFGPEHGVWADAQDLVEVGETRDPRTGLR